MTIKHHRGHVRKLIFYLLFIFSLSACSDSNTQETHTVQQPIIANSSSNDNDTVTSTYPSPAYPAPSEGYPGYLESSSVDNFTVPAEGIPTFPGKLAFHTESYGGLQVAVLNGASGTIERVTQINRQAFEPDWSPSCQAIVFTRGEGDDTDFGVYTQALDGSGAVALFEDPSIYQWSGSWAPDGSVIAYQHNKDALINICFVDAEGNTLGCMERGAFSNGMPDWSPDGSLLVFGSNRDGNWEIYRVNYPDFSGLTRLTNNIDTDFHPRFSPDGQTIVFSSKRLGNYDVYTMNLDGSAETQLTSNQLDNRTPVWVDDNQVVFSSNRTDDWELYLMSADGGNARRLTYQEGEDQWPAWCSTTE